MKRINGYLLADVVAVITLMLFIVFLTNKTSPKYFAYPGMFAFLFIILQAKFGSAQIINRTGGNITTKDENGGEVATVPTGETKTKIVGAKVAGVVYKLPDGVHATATKSNKIRINSITGAFIYKVRGGKILDKQ